MTIFIADYYNAFVRAVGPDGIMRNVTDESAVWGAPSRVAFEPRRRYLYVADSSKNNIVALNIPRVTLRPLLVPAPRSVRPGAARRAPLT